MTTTDKNKLLAEFMGLFEKISEHKACYTWNDSPFYFTSETTKEKVIDNISKYVKYDTDWNWLMQVVQKIESLGYWVNRITGDVWIQDDYGRDIIDNTLHQGGIEATYNACVSFVEWYNNQINIGA